MKRIERKERWAAVMGEQALAWKQRDWEVIQSRKQYLYYRNSHGINMKEVVDSLIKEKRSNTSNLVISMDYEMTTTTGVSLLLCIESLLVETIWVCLNICNSEIL